MAANGHLLFGSASHARWAARTGGGTINGYDTEGRLFKTIEIDADISGENDFVLPSV